MTKLNVDCLNLIFNELQKDIKSLHSCLLVNREWCHVVVPILWENCDYGSEKKLFNTILSCLPSSSKQYLFDNDIKFPSTILLKPLLFDYISFCKFVYAESIDKIINIIFGESNTLNGKRNLLEQEIYKLFVSQCKNIKELQWSTSQPLSLFPGALTCFSQLYSLSVDVNLINSNALYEMSKICKRLNKLTISGSQYLPGLISLIDAQKNLKSISLSIYNNEGICEELGKALARKGNTINYIHLDPFDYGYLAISKFPELQTLSIFNVHGLSCFKELATLIERTKGNILRICIDIYNKTTENINTGILIKAIANNCPRIEWLHTYFEPKDLIHVKSLLINCRNLSSLELDSSFVNFVNENYDYVGDELLDILAKFSPKSLIDIKIIGDLKYSVDAFGRFFESRRERALFRFDIFSNDKCYITEEHKIIVRRYLNESVVIISNCK